MDNEDRMCADCGAWKQFTVDMIWGQCRRKSPSFNPNVGTNESEDACWPACKADDWCCESVPRP